MQPFFAYLLRCRDGSYYAGHTDDLEARFAQHQAGEFEGYTSAQRPVELVWSEEFDTREEALELELKLKKWTRAKKEALMRGDWAAIKALARGLDRAERGRVAERPGSSPFDSGPAFGRPYAQGERKVAERRSGDERKVEEPRLKGERKVEERRSGGERKVEEPRLKGERKVEEPRLKGEEGAEVRSSDRAERTTGPERAAEPIAARPERSGRAAAAESKGELTQVEPQNA